jgi:DNA (cytosine-5)-methyltransferase 1
MTPREYARLQGVLDDYPIPSQVNQALTGFDDAVCVSAVTWIAENILNPLIRSFQ